MSAKELADRLLKETQLGSEFDWQKMREDIINEHGHAATMADRILCLGMHKALLDAVERQNIEPQNIENFRRLRTHDYRVMLIAEAIIGRTDGKIDPIKMAAITSREVQAGRLAADDEIHTLAVAGAEILGRYPERKNNDGLVSKVRSWFRK